MSGHRRLPTLLFLFGVTTLKVLHDLLLFKKNMCYNIFNKVLIRII